MPKSALSQIYLRDEKAAYAFVEGQLWADGRPVRTVACWTKARL